MKDTATYHVPAKIAKSSTVHQVFSVFWYAGSASLAIAAGGALLTTATEYPLTQTWPAIAAVASLPWGIVGLVLTWAVYRHTLPLVEEVTQMDLNDDDVTGPPQPNNIRLIEYQRQRPLVDGHRQEDLGYFIGRICRTGDATQATWRKLQLPSGSICNNRIHRSMCETVEKTGYLVNRGRGTPRSLTTRDPDVILEALRMKTQ